jgi:hypothetical protein
MSSPIKPPGGKPAGGVSPEDVAGTGSAKGPGKAAEAFRDALEGARGADASTAAGAADPVRAVAADLAAGRIDAATAVDRLVARALESGGARGLPPVRRAELEALLRASLAEDPTLVSLTKDLERGG